jgi:alkylation response protein AidB-like acyl-CoA dehydrogenase
MTEQNNWIDKAKQLGSTLRERARGYDAEDRFVAENYAELKRQGFFTLAIPTELGGGGASYEETCRVLYELGRCCASTALALSMHTHLVAANVWKYHHGKPDAEPVLRKIVDKQLVLVSTGATDWINSNGTATKVEGGYRITGRKRFASGSPGADVLITTAVSGDEPEGPSVLHFALPLSTDGVRLEDDWHTLGMRGTGSHSVSIDNAFVPEAAISLKRPVGQWHPAWSVVLGVAPPIYMSVYMGLADAACEHALDEAKKKPAVRRASAVGELITQQTAAKLAWEDMLRVARNYDFAPTLEVASQQLVRKTLLSNAMRRVTELCIEVTGGSGFFQASPLERAWRDAQASQFHPLPERRQWDFCGRYALGLDVVDA